MDTEAQATRWLVRLDATRSPELIEELDDLRPIERVQRQDPIPHDRGVRPLHVVESRDDRADLPASIDNCAQRVRSIRQSSRLIPTCAYVRSNNRWIWLKSVSFTKKSRDARLRPD